MAEAEIPLYVVNAFTIPGQPGSGNPAAVCILDQWKSEAWMQDVAAEMNLSETAFTVPGENWFLRWFTPEREVALCGHATIATAAVLADRGLGGAIKFSTASGELVCRQDAEKMSLAMPRRRITPIEPEGKLLRALGITSAEGFASEDENLLFVLASPDEVANLTPDFGELRNYSDKHGYIVTARDGADIVIRYFAPAWGIDEDPATGSAQATAATYWRSKLGNQYTAYQLSARGARLDVTVDDDQVVVSGYTQIVQRGAY